eukprot:2643979-Rhodomonas_salina.1
MSTDDEEDSDDWLDAQVGKTDRTLVRAGDMKSSRGRHWQSESGGGKGGQGDKQSASDSVRESGGGQSKYTDGPAGEPGDWQSAAVLLHRNPPPPPPLS